jgi:hypothetical protein
MSLFLAQCFRQLKRQKALHSAVLKYKFCRVAFNLVEADKL